MSIGEDEGRKLALPGPGASRVHVQTAQAAESAVVVQVGGDLYLSDSALTSLWSPAQTTPGDCPYPGLDAYGPGQAKWFFGRETVTGELLRYLDAMARGGPGGPLLVVAPSGTGKSSLLGAGLLNALAEGRLPVPGSAAWPRLMITPGSQPQRTLRSALATLATAQTAAADSRFVVVIDQLEEVFTLCESERERAHFFDEIGTLAADAGPGSALVVLGMRADFYAQAAAYPVLRQSMQSRQVVVGAMSAAEVRQAIIRPARAVGLTLEAGLTDRLLRDLGVDEGPDAGQGADVGPVRPQDATRAMDASRVRDASRLQDEGTSAGGSYEPGRLPLLAHALRATWRHRDGSRLTIAGYEATGGIGGAIARTADDVYAGLDGPAQAAARQLFLGLVRIGAATGDGSATADTRRRVAAADLLGRAADVAAARAALDAFTAARLLTSGGQAVEITHEALLRRWPRLREWIDEDRSGLMVRQELEDAAASWAREGRDAAGLYGGVRLAAAQGWAADPAHLRELTPPGREFLGASERRRRRGVRRRNGVIAVLAALSLLLASLSVFALNQRSVAQDQRSAAQTSYTKASAALLAAEAGQAWADFRPDAGLRFAVQADRLDPSSSQVRSTLLTTQAVPIAGRLLVNGTNQETNLVDTAFNPAGTVIAGTTQDGRVQLWSAATRQLLWNFHFSANAPQVNGVAFSPVGNIMAVTKPGGPWLFDVSDPAHPVHVATLKVPAITGDPDPQVTSLAYSPDGTTLAAAISTSQTSTVSGIVLLWNASTRALSGVVPEDSLAQSVTFTPDGRSLLVAVDNGGVDLWNIARGTKTVVQAPNTATPGAGGAAVSPDGQTIAFGTENATTGVFAVKLWSVATHQVLSTASANGASGITTVAFSPDGTQFAAAGFDGTVRLWQVPVAGSTPVLIGNFSGHRYLIEHIAFSPDSATLASASDDGSIDLWDTRGTLLGAGANPSDAVAFSPDGKTLAISTAVAGQYAVALYSMPGRKLARTLPTAGVAALAFSPDGKTLAVASGSAGAAGFGDPVQLWNVASGQLTGQFTTGLTSVVVSIAFSPDGTLLAVSAEGSTIMQVWSTATLSQVASFSDTQDTDYPPSLGGGVFAVAFSPDGRLLAVVGIDGRIRVYSVPGFTLLVVFKPLDSTSSLSFSPNGRQLALGSSDGNVYVYSIPVSYAHLPTQLKIQGALSASTKRIYSVEFLPNGTLVAAGADGIARFWTVPPGTFNGITIPAESLNTHVGAIASVSYSAPLGLLATASPLGSRVWQTNPAQVAATICQTLKTPASKQLWKEYLPDIPYTPVCG